MAKKSKGFNLAAAIRDYRKSHRGISAKNALEEIKKAHPNEKINDGTFKSTFYKLAGGKRNKNVMRRKPQLGGGGGQAESIMRAGLTFIRLAGGVENARERLVGLEELIETARVVSEESEGPILTGP
jgi:hypothetical protein